MIRFPTDGFPPLLSEQCLFFVDKYSYFYYICKQPFSKNDCQFSLWWWKIVLAFLPSPNIFKAWFDLINMLRFSFQHGLTWWWIYGLWTVVFCYLNGHQANVKLLNWSSVSDLTLWAASWEHLRSWKQCELLQFSLFPLSRGVKHKAHVPDVAPGSFLFGP